MAGSFGRNRGRVTEAVILHLLVGDFSQTTCEIVGVDDHKSARACGQFVHNLLVGAGAGRKSRHDNPRLRHWNLDWGCPHRSGGCGAASVASRSSSGPAGLSPSAAGLSTAAFILRIGYWHSDVDQAGTVR